MNDTLQPTNIGWNRCILITAIAAVLGSGVAWWVAPHAFFKSWLAAVLLPWSISLGSLTLMLVFCLTGGRWGRAAWPWLAMNTRLMPLVALLFVPWLFGIESIYPWANSNVLSEFENTENRRWLFQVPFFAGRTVFYFAVWTVLGGMIAGSPWSPSPLLKGNPGSHLIVGGEAAAGLGLVVILLTVTFAAIDWVMSFDPFFTSTLFGGLIGIGAMLSALSATLAAVCFWKPLHGSAMDDKTIGDLSNLLLAFLMLWAYFSFAHFLIMWSGDLPIEVRFYAVRTRGGWGWIAPMLSIGGFVVPFLCLLSYDLKRTPRMIGTLALCLLFARMVELWWMVLPANTEEKSFGWHWSVLPTTLAVVAVYSSGLTALMRRAELNQPPETNQ